MADSKNDTPTGTTEGMIRVGAKILMDLLEAGPISARYIAKEVYEAMEKARGNADITLIRCSKCGAKAAAFVCSTPGCPVNGGAAYG